MHECQTNDGKVLKEGAVVRRLKLQHGATVKEVSGKLRAFEDEDGVVRWEVATGDPTYPAVGFLPDNALTLSGS